MILIKSFKTQYLRPFIGEIHNQHTTELFWSRTVHINAGLLQELHDVQCLI